MIHSCEPKQTAPPGMVCPASGSCGSQSILLLRAHNPSPAALPARPVPSFLLIQSFPLLWAHYPSPAAAPARPEPSSLSNIPIRQSNTNTNPHLQPHQHVWCLHSYLHTVNRKHRPSPAAPPARPVPLIFKSGSQSQTITLTCSPTSTSSASWWHASCCRCVVVASPPALTLCADFVGVLWW